MAGLGGIIKFGAAFLVAIGITGPLAAADGAKERPFARTAQSGPAVPFNIAAQPLTAAIEAFSEQSGLEVAYTTADLDGLEGNAVTGAHAPRDALRRLLQGTGITWRFTGARTVVLERPDTSGAVTLDPVTVEGKSETAWGPVDGYVATRSAAGSKTDTPLIETPQSVSVITRDQMAAQGASSLADALRYTPGVTGELYGIDTRGYGLQFRGFGKASDAKFYRDGLQLKGTAFASFLTLDPYGAERLDTLRGPASVLYGQGEPEGIINYITKRPLETPFYEVEGGIGNFDRYEGKFDISGPVTDDKSLLLRLTGLARTSDTQVDFVGAERFFIAPALTWRPTKDTTLTVNGHYQYDDVGWAIQFYPAQGTVEPNPNGTIPTSRFTGEPDFDDYELTQYSAGYLFEHRFNEMFQVRQNFRYAHLDNEQEGVFGSSLQGDLRTYDRYGDSGVSELDAIVVDSQAQADFTTDVLRHTLLGGLDFKRYRYSDLGSSYDVDPIDLFNPVYGSPIVFTGDYQDTDQKHWQVGLYLQDQIRLGNWALTLSGRQDWARTRTSDSVNLTSSDQKDHAFSGRAGLVYLFDGGVAPYFSYSESFLPVLGTDAAGAAFDPETGRQYEIGVKYQPPGWNAFVTVAAFELVRDNVLTTDPNNVNEQVQSGERRSRGIELEASASLDFGLDFKGAYALLDTEIANDNEGNEGNTPHGVPTHRLSLWADYTVPDGPLGGLGFGGGMRHIGSTYGDDANTFKVPAVTLFDASVHYDWKKFRFAIKAKNLFDKEYVASCFEAGFGCFYGERRVVVGTVRYRW